MQKGHLPRQRRNHHQEALNKRRVQWLTLTTVVVALSLVVLVMAIQAHRDGVQSDIFALHEQPSLGSDAAPVKVVEFGDFDCPHCATFEREVFQRLKSEFIDTGQVQFFFIHFPIMGTQSMAAARAAEAIMAQDEAAFWQFYQALYQNQGPVDQQWATDEFLVSLARQVEPTVDYAAVAAALRTGGYLDEVRRDYAIGKRVGVKGTPAVFVNGDQVVNWSYEGLKAAIDRELGVTAGD